MSNSSQSSFFTSPYVDMFGSIGGFQMISNFSSESFTTGRDNRALESEFIKWDRIKRTSWKQLAMNALSTPTITDIAREIQQFFFQKINFPVFDSKWKFSFPLKRKTISKYEVIEVPEDEDNVYNAFVVAYYLLNPKHFQIATFALLALLNMESLQKNCWLRMYNCTRIFIPKNSGPSSRGMIYFLFWLPSEYCASTLKSWLFFFSLIVSVLK